MAKKATTSLATQPMPRPIGRVDARIAVGMFFTLTGTILAAFGFSTRDRADIYQKSLGIDANLWWGVALLVFGIVMLAFGRRGQAKIEQNGE